MRACSPRVPAEAAALAAHVEPSIVADRRGAPTAPDRDNRRAMASVQTLSHVYPIGSRVNDRGRLEIGGCDVIELAERFGTPAYVVAEDDLRARARAFIEAFRAAGHDDFEVIFASKAFPATAVMALFAPGGPRLRRRLGRRAAPRAARRLRRRRRSSMHGNARDDARAAHGARRRRRPHRDRQRRRHRPPRAADRRRRAPPAGADPRHARACAATPTRRSRPARPTRSSASASATRPPRSSASARVAGPRPARPAPPHRLAALRARAVPRGDRGDRAARRLPRLRPRRRPRRRLHRRPAAAPDRRVRRRAASTPRTSCSAPGRRLLIEPGRALVANGGVTLYRVIGVKHNVSTWVAVDGGMSDNLRPMLYGARYEADIADRLGGATRVHLTGKHCESGDVADPRRAARRPAARRRRRDAGDRRLRPRDGQQLQRRAAPAGDLLQRRRGARGRARARRSTTCTPAMCDRRVHAPAGDRRMRRSRVRRMRRRLPHMSALRIGLLGHGTVGAAFERLLARARGRDRAPDRPRARDRRRADALARRLRRDPRALGADRRADRRRRSRARVRAARARRRAATSSPPTSSCSRGTARSCGRWRASAACSSASRPRSPASCRSIRVLRESLAGRARRAHPRDRQRHDELHPQRDDADRLRLRARRSPQAQRAGLRRGRPDATTSAAPTRRRRWRSSRGWRSASPVHIDDVRYDGHHAAHRRRHRLRARARALAEADRHRRARWRRASRCACIRRSSPSGAPARVGRRLVQRRHRRVGRDHRDHDVRAGRRRLADGERGARRRRRRDRRGRRRCRRPTRASPIVEDVVSPFYVHMEVDDEPGVLAQIAGAFGDVGASIKSVVQRGTGERAQLIMVTHPLARSRSAHGARGDRQRSRSCARRRARSA